MRIWFGSTHLVKTGSVLAEMGNGNKSTMPGIVNVANCVIDRLRAADGTRNVATNFHTRNELKIEVMMKKYDDRSLD